MSDHGNGRSKPDLTPPHYRPSHDEEREELRGLLHTHQMSVHTAIGACAAAITSAKTEVTELREKVDGFEVKLVDGLSRIEAQMVSLVALLSSRPAFD